MEKLTERRIPQNATICFDMVGCKLNRYELELMRNQAEGLGLKPVRSRDLADVVVVNTCSVTHEASRDSAKMVRRFRRKMEEAYIVVTGCWAQTDAEDARKQGADLLLSNFEKDKFGQILSDDLDGMDPEAEFHSQIFGTVEFQSRPFLKVQDGCDAFCSYCIIPRARGRSRGIDPKVVLGQIEELAPRYPEIVLSGVNIGQYTFEDLDFMGLLKKILKIEPLQLIRISSIEPQDVTQEFMDLVIQNPKICPHLHIPLQGAHNQLLKDMRRHYTVEDYREKLLYLKKHRPDMCLGADVMVGFPTEDQAMFEQSREILESMPLDYLHVFTFSSRKKTVAERLEALNTEAERKERNHIFTDYSNRRKAAFMESMQGKTLDAVVERGGAPEGFLKAMTENYIPVILKCDKNLELSRIRIRIEESNGNLAQGVLVSDNG